MIADACRRIVQLKPANLFKILIFFSIAGCQSVPVVDPGVETKFLLEGKVAIRYGEERFSARLRWHHLEDGHYNIQLWGPLGQGRTVLSGNPERIEIRDAGGQLLDAGAVRAVMERQLGWYLPLETMPAWVTGVPAPGASTLGKALDDQGRYVEFEQLGWSLAYEWRNAELPRRVTASKGDYRVRLVL